MGTSVDFGGDDLYVNALYTGNTLPGQVSQSSKGVSITAATVTATQGQAGSMFIFNSTAGTTVTLPPPVIGTSFSFVIGTVPTTGTDKVITNAGTVFLTGGLYIDKALTITRYDANGTTIVSVNLNGTTTGGASVGDKFTVTCISATEWTVADGTVTASGTLATPFATS
jgi:hypothetical protein